MAIREKYGSGTTAAKGDTKRMLWVKSVTLANGTPTQSDTKRILEGKLRKARAGTGQTINF